MTPERLDLIRERLDATGYAEWKTACRDLVGEVERLRDGIENVCNGASVHGARMHPDYLAALLALLNPTEGDDR